MTKVLSPSQVKEAVELYESGLSTTEIAERYPVTRQAVWALLRTRTTMRVDGPLLRGTAADQRAHSIFQRSKDQGKIVRETICEECGVEPGFAKDGRTKIDAHHDDYSKPLEVRWLCRPCHFAWHRKNIAKGATSK